MQIKTTEIALHTHKNDFYQNTQEIASIGEDVKKMSP